MEKIDWSKAPEWANAVGKTKLSGDLLWMGDIHYEYFNRDGKYDWSPDPTGPTRSKNSVELIEKRPSSWTGEGLPPVGLLFEAGIPHASGPSDENRSILWIEGRVIAYHEVKGRTYSWFATDDGFYPPGIFEFRPIRTPEQIAEEEREIIITEMVSTLPMLDNGWARKVCAALYDADYRKKVAE